MSTYLVRAWLAAALVAVAVPASAQTLARGEEDTEPQAERPTGEVIEVGELPEPTEASGLEVGPDEPSTLWWIPRVALFVPRLMVEAIDQPIRGALYVSDRYQVIERAEDLLFNDARTFGVYPIAYYDSGFGISGGAKLVHRDMFGARESLRLRALYGGRYNQEYKLELATGDRLRGRSLRLEGEIERRPRERFFGIGNGDVVDADTVTAPIDPLVDDLAVATRYRQNSYALRLGFDTALGAGLFAAVRSRLERRDFGRSTELMGDEPLADVYDPSRVLGFIDDVDTSYTEVELRYDTRRASDHFASAAMPADGALAAVRAGYNAEIGSDRPGFLRFELDLQGYLDLYKGTRTLGLRLFAVQTDADIDEIAFVDLPRLGGESLLRGYQTDRFRDRGLWLATAEYKFELNPKYLAGYLFVDAGRVERSLWDLELDSTRVGFGFGVQLHSLSSFLVRTHLASSRDGGLFFNLDFDPVADTRVRE